MDTRKLIRTLVLGGVSLVATGAAACAPGAGSPASDAAGDPPAADASFDGATPAGEAGSDPTAADGAAPVTYAQVREIFRASCSGYCHQGGTDVGASLVLYSLARGASGDEGYAQLVGRPSRQVPSMALVAPGRPEQSYLLAKVADAMGSVAECEADARRCGVAMPWGSPPRLLPAEQRDLLRRWIAAGAPR